MIVSGESAALTLSKVLSVEIKNVTTHKIGSSCSESNSVQPDTFVFGDIT